MLVYLHQELTFMILTNTIPYDTYYSQQEFNLLSVKTALGLYSACTVRQVISTALICRQCEMYVFLRKEQPRLWTSVAEKVEQWISRDLLLFCWWFVFFCFQRKWFSAFQSGITRSTLTCCCFLKLLKLHNTEKIHIF